MDKKLTDNEIKKALECCEDERVDCDKCPYNAENKCIEVLLQNTLDYINRLEAENERLKAKCENTQVGYNFAKDESNQWKEEANRYQNLWCKAEMDIQTANAEAYKEFAERLKKHERYATDVFDHTKMVVVRVEDVERVLKEMGGESNDKA